MGSSCRSRDRRPRPPTAQACDAACCASRSSQLMVTGLILPPKTDEQNAGSGIRGLATISHLTRPKRPPDHSNRNTVDRVTLPGGEWIRTFSSAQDSNSSCFRPSSADLPAHDHPSSCRPRRTDRVVGRGPESRHSPPGGGVTPRSRCRRCERIAEPKVRIRSSPAGSLQTFSSSRAATAMAKPDSSHSRTGSSNPVPSSEESCELDL
jgi:hypothetical protein